MKILWLHINRLTGEHFFAQTDRPVYESTAECFVTGNALAGAICLNENQRALKTRLVDSLPCCFVRKMRCMCVQSQLRDLCKKMCCVCVRWELALPCGCVLAARPSRVQDAHSAEGALVHPAAVMASVRSTAQLATQGNALQESVEGS